MGRNWHRRHTRRHLRNNPFSPRNLHHSHDFRRDKNRKKIFYWSIFFIILLFLYAYYQEDILNKIDSIKDFNGSSSLSEIVSETSSGIKNIVKTEPERKEECISAFNYVNELRMSNGKKAIDWDERAYALGVARTKDMYDKGYFDHVSPLGECAYSIKEGYGFSSSEDVAENIGASMWEGGEYTKTINPKNQVDGWMESRGHRYNLLYSNHNSGAIACYYGVCVFLGVNNDGFGRECSTGEEGLAFWEGAGKQSGEV